MTENCVVAAEITLISLPVTNLQLLPVSVRHLVFTSEEVPDAAGVGMTEKFANENRWNLVSS